LSSSLPIFHAFCLSSLKLAMSEMNCWWFFHWFIWFSFMGHDIKRSHLDCQREGIISGLEAEECPEKSKQWLLRIDTVFLQLFFPLQVVTTRTTLLILRGWHLGIAVRFEPVWKGKKPNRTESKLIGLNRFSVRFGSKTKKKRFGYLFWSKTGPNRKYRALL